MWLSFSIPTYLTHNVPIERLRVTFASSPKLGVSPLQSGCCALLDATDRSATSPDRDLERRRSVRRGRSQTLCDPPHATLNEVSLLVIAQLG